MTRQMATAGAVAAARATANLDAIPLTAAEEDPLTAMRVEITDWLETVVAPPSADAGLDDPVFETAVRDFGRFDSAMSALSQAVETFVDGVQAFSAGIYAIGDCLLSHVGRSKNLSLASDACKFREACGAVARDDAPHSVMAKLLRDLRYNVADPARAHVAHNGKIRRLLEVRRRRLRHYVTCRRAAEELARRPELVAQSAARLLRARAEEEQALAEFKQVDLPLFEWLLMLEEHRQDIYDSTVQTMKYLLYEFLAGASHCVAHVLPKRMEFRPMAEMTPAELQSQVEAELQEHLKAAATDDGAAPTVRANSTSVSVVATATNRVIRRGSEGDADNSKPACPALPSADPITASLLTAQGFEAGAVRTALQHHNNDAQEALDCLLNAHEHGGQCLADPALLQEVTESVRLPSSLKWIDRDRRARAAKRGGRSRRDRDSKEIDAQPPSVAETSSVVNASARAMFPEFDALEVNDDGALHVPSAPATDENAPLIELRRKTTAAEDLFESPDSQKINGRSSQVVTAAHEPSFTAAPVCPADTAPAVPAAAAGATSFCGEDLLLGGPIDPSAPG